MSEEQNPSITAQMAKRWIEELIELFRDPDNPRDRGIRKCARALGIDHERLIYLRDHEERLAEQFEIIEKARKLLKISESKMYRKLVSK